MSSKYQNLTVGHLTCESQQQVDSAAAILNDFWSYAMQCAETRLNRQMRSMVDTSIVASESIDGLILWYDQHRSTCNFLTLIEKKSLLKRVCTKIVVRRLSRAISKARCRKRHPPETRLDNHTPVDELPAALPCVDFQVLMDEQLAMLKGSLEPESRRLFDLICRGYDNADIASARGISVRSVQRQSRKMIRLLRLRFESNECGQRAAGSGQRAAGSDETAFSSLVLKILAQSVFLVSRFFQNSPLTPWRDPRF